MTTDINRLNDMRDTILEELRDELEEFSKMRSDPLYYVLRDEVVGDTYKFGSIETETTYTICVYAASERGNVVVYLSSSDVPGYVYVGDGHSADRALANICSALPDQTVTVCGDDEFVDRITTDN